jgi:hypothetical protein
MVDCSLYTYKAVDEKRNREIHARTHLPPLTGHGAVWRCDAMGARRAPEWSTEIQPKTS